MAKTMNGSATKASFVTQCGAYGLPVFSFGVADIEYRRRFSLFIIPSTFFHSNYCGGESTKCRDLNPHVWPNLRRKGRLDKWDGKDFAGLPGRVCCANRSHDHADLTWQDHRPIPSGLLHVTICRKPSAKTFQGGGFLE